MMRPPRRRRFLGIASGGGGGRRGVASAKAGGAGGTGENSPFDANVKRLQRARAAESCERYYDRHAGWRHRRLVRPRRDGEHQDGDDEQCGDDDDEGRKRTGSRPAVPYDYLHIEVARRLVDRLDDIRARPEGFPLALELGTRGDVLYDAIVDVEDYYHPDDDEGNDDDEIRVGRGGVVRLVRIDSCMPMLRRDDAYRPSPSSPPSPSSSLSSSVVCETFELASDSVDGTSPLPFPDDTFDLVMSSMSLQWTNDLPRLLREVERVLRPDGCFLFALPGGNTLPELRSCMVLAELERTGGVSPHVGPYVDPSHVGGLLTGCGFQLPTIDVDDVRVGYPNAMVLMEHLGRMGEGNACSSRRDGVGLGTFLGAACLYGELYPGEEEEEEGEGGGIVASAQVIYGIAWKEHESQQRPDDRGSATRKLTDISVTRTPSGA
jgi:NADH dehydrogenase [ubiquinone] 1 alpha subcomplex assembly factor 5